MMVEINIGILDADLLDNGTRHPNLALMKLSAFNKDQGHEVKLLSTYDNIKEYDKVYLSKVFDFTKMPDISQYNNIVLGGTGLYWDASPELSYEVEHHMPDYHLYDEFIANEIVRGIKRSYFLDYIDYSIGFTTRGCIRQCPFCISHDKTRVTKHSPVSEFLDTQRKYIYLWDDNFLAFSQWEEVLDDIEGAKKPYQFRQGLDIRLMTDKKAERLAKSKYKGDFIFAFDSIEEKDLIVKKIKMWKEHYTKKGNTKLYVLCAFDKTGKYDREFWKQDLIETFERIKILMEYGCIPYIMRYSKYEESSYRGMYITLARWCNQPSFFKKESLREYVYITDGIGREEKDYAAKRYINEFEKDYPDIAKMYYDIKYEDLKEY